MSFIPIAQNTESLNPIENIINSFNTNPYFIGSMMLLLNLGGRHLSTGLTPEQDKFFQQPWFRRALIFVIFFVATRNILTSFIMTIFFVLVIGYLFNDTSSLYLFNFSLSEKAPIEIVSPLTPEEQDIHKRLSDKIAKLKESQAPKVVEKEDISTQITETYASVMSRF